MSDYGWVYCLSNPSYKSNYFKIGCTKREDPITRIKELNGATGVPTNFELVYARRVKDYKKKEKIIHTLLSDCRVNKNREFFKYDKCKIEAIFSLMDGKWYSKDIKDPLYRPLKINNKKNNNKNKITKITKISGDVNFIKINITKSQQQSVFKNYITKGLSNKKRKLYKSLLDMKNTYLVFYYPKKEHGNYFGSYGIYKLLHFDINSNFKEFQNYYSKNKKINILMGNRQNRLTKEIKIMLKKYDEYIIYFKPIIHKKLKFPKAILKNNKITAIKNKKNILYLKNLIS